MKHFYIALYMLLLPCLFAVENANLVDNPGAERLDEQGKVVGWRQVKYNPVGELFVDKGSPKGGANSFGISCTEKPSKPLGWGFYLDKKAFDGIAPGSPMTISFDLTTFANPSVIVRCYAEFKDGNNFVGTFGANHSVYAGWERKQFTFPMLTRNYTSCIVYFMLKSEGKACIDNVDFRQGVSSTFKAISDDYCRVKDLPPRRTWFSPARPAKLDIEYKLSKPELKVTLAEIDGKELQTWTFDNLQTGKTETQTIELPSLPEGAYELIFKSGELDDNEWFAIRAENNNNVHFTSDGFLIFKGKPVFPIAIAHPNRLGKAGADGLRVYAESGVNLISEYHINGPKHAAYLNAMTKQFGFMLWLKEEFGFGEMRYTNIGPTIGSNCGPGLMAVFFWGRERDMKGYRNEQD